MKQRGAVVIIENGELIVIQRVRAGRVYYLFPGGGVEPSETPEQAAVREAREELGLDVELGSLLAVVTHEASEQYYFLAAVTGGKFGSGDGEEMSSPAESEEGSYRAMRLPLAMLSGVDLRPRALGEVLASGQTYGKGEPVHRFYRLNPSRIFVHLYRPPFARKWVYRGNMSVQNRLQREKKDHIEAVWLALSPVIGQLTVALLLALLAMFVFIKLAHDVADDETRQFDVAVLKLFVPYRHTLAFHFMTMVSWLASGGPQTVLVCLIVAFFTLRKQWMEAATTLLSDVGGLGIIIWLKRLFHRPRPEEIFSHLGYSFPSGHSFFAVVVYGLIGYWLARDATPKQRRIVWAVTAFCIFLVGFSRMFVGEHFPSDVAAGYAVALPWLWGCLAIPGAFHRRGHDLSPEEVRMRYRAGKAQLVSAARHRKDLIGLTRGLGGDPRVPGLRRAALRFTAGYLAMPLDLLPDFIPVLGIVDDILLTNRVLRGAAKAVPPDVIREHWNGGGDPFVLLDNAMAGIKDLMNRG